MQTETKVAYIDGQAYAIHEMRPSCLSSAATSVATWYCHAVMHPTWNHSAPAGCSVDVALQANGAVRTVASCHTPVQPGYHISPSSENVQKLRKNIIELVLTDHPLDCLTCEVNGNCELQDVAAKVGIRKVRYPEGKTHLDRQKDLSHPYMTSDLSKCINCYRCVRACDEAQDNSY